MSRDVKRIAKGLAAIAAVSMLVFSWIGCESTVPEEEKADVQTEGDRIFIVDRTGKKWDVTHAVEKYGFVASDFQHGLGPDAIPPILDPVMLSEGQKGYPGDNENHIVIGTTINGDKRAYGINQLNSHEIVDESFGDVHVAVGW